MILLPIAFQLQACSGTGAGIGERQNNDARTVLTQPEAACAFVAAHQNTVGRAVKERYDSVDFYTTDLEGRTILHRAAACKEKIAFLALLNKASLQYADRPGNIRSLLLKKVYGSDHKLQYSVLTAAVMTRPKWFHFRRDDAFEKFQYVLLLALPYLEERDFRSIERELHLMQKQQKITQEECERLCKIVDETKRSTEKGEQETVGHRSH